MRRERVAAALAHETTDKVPHHVEITTELAVRVAKVLGIQTTDLENWADNHCEKVSYNIGGKVLNNARYMDEFGVTWNRSGGEDIGVVESTLIPQPMSSDYQFPSPNLTAVRERTEQALTSRNDRFLFGKIGTTYFERAWSLCGMENLLMWFALEPVFVKDIFQRILDYNLQIIDVALEYDIDGFYFGDDYGQQTGLIMSPEMWREFIKPGLKEMFSRIKSKGRVVALHSCGNIEGIMADLIEIGLDVYQTFQPEVYDVVAMKAKYGRSISFWGGISTQRTLPFATPEEIQEETRRTLSIVGDGGGYIAGPTHRIPGDVPVENVRALVETLKNQ